MKKESEWSADVGPTGNCTAKGGRRMVTFASNRGEDTVICKSNITYKLCLHGCRKRIASLRTPRHVPCNSQFKDVWIYSTQIHSGVLALILRGTCRSTLRLGLGLGAQGCALPAQRVGGSARCLARLASSASFAGDQRTRVAMPPKRRALAAVTATARNSRGSSAVDR